MPGRIGCTLTSFGEQSAEARSVARQEVLPGDSILVRTKNSVYSMRLKEDGMFCVSGGWFRRKGKEQSPTAVVGCSFGGSMIRIDIVVACGFSIEFSNRVITSPVRSFFVFRSGWAN